MTISDFNSPFYWVYTFMFLGVAWTNVSLFRNSVRPYVRTLWLSATLLMSAVCMGLAFMPFLGKAVLGFSSVGCVVSIVLLYLILRAWRTPLSRYTWLMGGGYLVFFMMIYNLLLHSASVQARVAFIMIPTVLISLWGIYEAYMLSKLRSSIQHKFLISTQGVLLLVALVWELGIIFMDGSLRMTETQEPASVAVGRLIIVSLVLILMIAMVGVATERLFAEKSKLLEQNMQSEALNKRLAWTLQERNQMLKALSFSSDARNSHSLISNLAHEMNQPLGSIRLYADYLLHAPDLTRDEQEDVLHKIVSGSERAQQSLKDFRLFFSTMQDPEQEVRLDALIREILELFAAQLADAKIELTLDIQDNVLVSADVAQLKMVILNLLSNAMDALYEHPQPRRIQISLGCDKNLACFVIHDSGPGVPKELRDKIFESFFSTKDNGVGLGLWLCRAIVGFYGGAMSASLEGPGARFDFNLPRVAQKDKK